MLSLVQEVVVLVVGPESLPIVSFLGALPLVLNMRMGGVIAWSWKGGTVHGFPFRGFGPPLVSEGWFPHNGSHGGSMFDRMDRCIDRHGRMNVANPTFKEMARHWFATFATNPSVESVARSRSWF
jgi:hypothetical protein